MDIIRFASTFYCKSCYACLSVHKVIVFLFNKVGSFSSCSSINIFLKLYDVFDYKHCGCTSTSLIYFAISFLCKLLVLITE
jgi:hypothetical protein